MNEVKSRAFVVREPGVVMLNRSAFGDCVREALRSLPYPQQFATNPLLESYLVTSQDGAPPVQTLRRVLTEAIRELAEDSRNGRFGRAVAQAYLRGDLTQDRAAAKLCVSLSSYKRHLATGIERICDQLWQRELSGRLAVS